MSRGTATTPQNRDCAQAENRAQPEHGIGLIWHRWWWVSVLVACVFVFGNWLVRESATLYGDEAAHLEMALGVREAFHEGDGFLDGLWRAYLGGNGRYPPLAHACMLIAMTLGANPLVGARLVSAVFVSVGVLTMSAAGHRATGSRWCGLLIGVLMLGSTAALEGGRFAYLESSLVMWIGLLSLCFVSYVRRPAWKWWILASCVVGLGQMCKFNYAMYASPFLGGIALFELLRWKRRETGLGAVLLRLVVACLIVGLIAGPWYLTSLRNPANAGSGLQSLIDTGHLRVVRTPGELWVSWGRLARWLSSPFALVVGCAVMLCWSAWWMRRRPSAIAGDWYAACALIGVAVWSIGLPWIGLGDQGRWHLQFVPMSLAMVVMLHTIAWRPVVGRTGESGPRSMPVRVLGAGLACLLMVKPIAAIAMTGGMVRSGAVPEWSASDAARFFRPPDARSMGNRELALLIDGRFPARADGQMWRVSFMVHDHRGFHSQTLAWELDRLGREDIRIDRVGFMNRPVSVDWFLGADLVVTSATEPLISDAESARYQHIEDRLEGLVGPSFVNVGEIASRHLVIRVCDPAGWGVDGSMALRFIDEAWASDGREGMVAYYDVQRALWACRFGLAMPDATDQAIRDAGSVAGESLRPTAVFIEKALADLKACRAGSRAGDDG